MVVTQICFFKFSSLYGEMIQFDLRIIFKMGWFNHQLEEFPSFFFFFCGFVLYRVPRSVCQDRLRTESVDNIVKEPRLRLTRNVEAVVWRKEKWIPRGFPSGLFNMQFICRMQISWYIYTYARAHPSLRCISYN